MRSPADSVAAALGSQNPVGDTVHPKSGVVPDLGISLPSEP
jgi:hypothetical protein